MDNYVKMTWLSNKRLEILAGVNILCRVVLGNYNPDDIKIFKKFRQQVRTISDDSLTFWKLDINTIKIVVYSYGTFSSKNNRQSKVV